ncbi:TPA: hypothetical protein N0F65_006453 [Lagenidium giganteum]|uniref:Endoplasmic reticulum-Golgi intermediate compartment protein n=1 Tax=Lagenidium giganteum TaxID=4803 RepID=A0AAV2Z3B9_9STRA|nr:TPA: hypothetical protein N0F65_006453 [Lagenidium giganteum]
MRAWRQFDVYTKGLEGIQERTIGGGVVTLISCICVAFLLLSEVSVWWTVEVVNRMHVDTEPQESPIDVVVDVTFLHEKCQDVAIDVSDAKGNKEILLKEEVEKQPFGESGCRFVGSVQIKKVAGDITFAHEGSLNIYSFFDFLNFNSSHVVNHLRFGPIIPKMETPLIDVHKTVLENVATYKYFVNIVPTKYIYLSGQSITTYQYSVTEHVMKNEESNQLSFPGVMFSYEFSPIAVEYVETKPTILQFITSSSAIVGGIFAVARMIDGAIYSVSKKVD